ncbi:YXWGXW repeat-containing protein [Piscinibacter koreensis]|uniref:YXWGXW repeat-containing protein n=1 Tax=Piscinibacter koreensis TaxID=2742824 RepID=A0A7Y6TXL6_9BURK|nr:YXWGXW repeat-containing protein [Schlegelella koreensis]NUZ07176.1 YXWGXW repeat-containing protein [Schlegelella koreensis]
MKKTLLAAALVAASLGGGVAAPAIAQPRIEINVAPPPPRHEVVPAPRRGWVWSPGHWEWRGRRHVWVEGSWVRERPGYVYAAPTWVERNGRWYYERGGWERGRRDRDRDGVPNRFDRDRDGDGVPNRRDDSPNNPYRR